MQKFVKKPVVIEAIQYNGENIEAIEDFVGKKLSTVMASDVYVKLIIPTLEGNMKASKGDYVIKGVKGEFYPCKPDIFKEIYSLVTEKSTVEKNELTFGEKAVGLPFNPSNDDKVSLAKQLIADTIDLLEEDHKEKTFNGQAMSSWTRNVFITAAFNALIAAQMAVVKYLTWKD